MKRSLIHVGLDVHQNSIVVAMATRGEPAIVVRSMPNDWSQLLKTLMGLGHISRLRVCYEAGPTGYDLARRLNAAGICCVVIAPSLVPVQKGVRIKTDRRDAIKLANLHQAGQLVAVTIPDAETEAMRDLERSRDDAKNAERAARHQLDKFLLRQGRTWSQTRWTHLHWGWIKRQEFPDEASRRVLADYIRAVQEATARVERLEDHIKDLVETSHLAPLVRALQALRGVQLITAVILAAEIGDFARFATPRQLMAFLGLVPSEDSSGQRRRQGRITRTGNGHARRILTEAAWNYRFVHQPSRAILKRRESLPPEIVAIAEKAERRLSRRFRHLTNSRKPSQKVATAIARELAGFVWAIAREVTSQAA